MKAIIDYQTFLHRRGQRITDSGFEPVWLPDCLFDFQKACVEWALLKGRGALFEDCGLGKTLQELVWAQNVVEHTNRAVLILAPLAVAAQTCREAEKFGIKATQSRDGKHGGEIVVTNYELLHHFNPDDFAGIVLDESSILKSVSGAIRKRVTRFMSKLNYRLLATATAAPNDYVELGTSSEALGYLSHSDMLRQFFMYLDDKGQRRERILQEKSEAIIADDPNYYRKLAFRVAQTIGQWRLKHHAVTPFWRWVASWARACRKPSDLGFSDDGFVLPPLNERDHIITPRRPPPGMLFNVPAFGMHEERQERRRTLGERCGFVADLVKHDRPAMVWCHMNCEGDALERSIPDARQVAGSMPLEKKEELLTAFLEGQLRVLITKPKIAGLGINAQHCNHVVTFPTHSFESHYQIVRRCWRFGQINPVDFDVVATEGEIRVLGNMRRKGVRAMEMFASIIREMNAATGIDRRNEFTERTLMPSWL